MMYGDIKTIVSNKNQLERNSTHYNPPKPLNISYAVLILIGVAACENSVETAGMAAVNIQAGLEGTRKTRFYEREFMNSSCGA